MIGPAISFITSTAVYYWQVYAPIISAIEGLLSLSNTTNDFDADRIKEMVEVFQEKILQPSHSEQAIEIIMAFRSKVLILETL